MEVTSFFPLTEEDYERVLAAAQQERLLNAMPQTVSNIEQRLTGMEQLLLTLSQNANTQELTDENEALKAKLAEMMSVNATLHCQLEEQMDLNAEAFGRINEYKARIAELESEHATQSGTIQELQNKIQQTTHEYANIELEFSRLRKRYEESEKALQTLSTAHEKMQAALSASKEKCDKQEKLLADAAAEKESLLNRQNNLVREISILREQRSNKTTTPVVMPAPSNTLHSVNSREKQLNDLIATLQAHPIRSYDSYLFAANEAKFAKKLANARNAYAILQPGETPILLHDDTVLGSAKDGFLLTDRSLHAKVSSNSFSFPLSSLADITVSDGGTAAFITLSFLLKDGAEKKARFMIDQKNGELFKQELTGLIQQLRAI